MTQNIGVMYKEFIQPKDGKGWEETRLDIRTLTFRRKLSLHVDGGLIYNANYKGEISFYMKVGELKDKKGYIYDPLTMPKPLRFFLEDFGEKDGKAGGWVAKIVCEING